MAQIRTIYLLRHEERGKSSLFFSELTKQGMENAKTKIITKLEKHKIDKIYCSPLIRTLQTIQPYCKKHDKNVFIENSLYEHNPIKDWENQTIYGIHDVNDDELLEIVHKKSKSYLPLADVVVSTSLDDKNREVNVGLINKFIDYLIEETKDDNILLVGHMGGVNIILEYFQGIEYKAERYNTGKLTKIVYNNGEYSIEYFN